MIPLLSSAALLFALAFPSVGDGVPGDSPDAPIDGGPGRGDSYFSNLGNGGYDALHYDLDITLDATLDQLTGVVKVKAKALHALKSFNLELHQFEIDALEVDGVAAPYTRDGLEMTVTPAQPIARDREFEVLVRYHGTPKGIKSPALDMMPALGWMKSKTGAYVVSEPDGAASLYPVNDHPSDKATYRIAITVPPPWIAASNGTLVSEEKVGDAVKYSFAPRDPMASYLVTLAVAEYDVVDQTSASGLPLKFYFPKRMAEQRREALLRTGEMIDFLAEKFGPYPFECGGAIVSTIAIPGALETQTRPIYGYYAVDEGVVVHELAHQWFGNNVTMRDWREIWLAEGFAEYGAWMWIEKQEGKDALEDTVSREYSQVRKRKVGPSGDPGAGRLFGSESYNRGPVILHELRRTIGDEKFFALLKAWNAKYRYGNATIDDFCALANEVSGQNVTPFLRAWLFDRVVPPRGEL